MTIGTGIFLSAVIFGVLTLYYITRDRWNWPSIMRRFGIGAASLVVIAIFFAVAIWGYEKITNLPQRQTTYSDIDLGMKMLEVRYVKGEPSYVMLPTIKSGPYAGSAPIIESKNFKQGQLAENYLSWGYDAADKRSYVEVDFDSKTRKVDQITCYSEGFFNCPPLLGILDGDEEENVISRLGQPTHVAFETGSGVKRLTYTNLNVRYYLLKKRVYMLQVGLVN